MKLRHVAFSMEINSGNAALVENPQSEIFSMMTKARAWLTTVADGDTVGDMDELVAELPLWDTNGNRVGYAAVTLDFEGEEGGDDA